MPDSNSPVPGFDLRLAANLIDLHAQEVAENQLADRLRKIAGKFDSVIPGKGSLDPCSLAVECDAYDAWRSEGSRAAGAADSYIWLARAEIARQRESTLIAALEESRALFRHYEALHRARGPEHTEKADRNARMAERIDAAIAPGPQS